MFVNKISLSNFRNVSLMNLSFDSPMIVFYGNNGQGKTNIAECIYLLANATSFRTNSFKEMIQTNKDEAFVSGEIVTSSRKNKYKVNLSKSGKTVSINDLKISRISDYIGKVNAICFAPEDVSIFKDSPSDRRAFLDKELSSMFPVYIKQLIQFNKILDERNVLLKSSFDETLLEVLDSQLIEASFDIYKRRKWLLYKLIEFASRIYHIITKDTSKIKIVYKSYLDEMDKDTYIAKAKELYKASLSKDKEKLFTTIGVHKDDFKVYLNDLEIDMYASQGQQRLVSLCLKLAVAEIVAKANKEDPILILDDAFSELDEFKKNKLFEYLGTKQQVFITCTDYRDVVSPTHSRTCLYLVKDGKVIERSFA